VSLRNDGLFTPPSYRGTIAFPGNVGGVNWGSAAWDPQRNILLANTKVSPSSCLPLLSCYTIDLALPVGEVPCSSALRSWN